MCRGCRYERLSRYDGRLSAIRKRAENYARQQPDGVNPIAIDRAVLLNYIDRLKSGVPVDD